MMARPRREFDVAQLLQLAPPDGLIEQDRKFVMEPLDQIDQSPAHNLMDRWDRAAFDSPPWSEPASGLLHTHHCGNLRGLFHVGFWTRRRMGKGARKAAKVAW